MLTDAEKTARYEQRKRARGFKKVHLWVPNDRAAELAAIAGRMRRERESDALRAKVVTQIKRMRKFLRSRGITGLALFGSLARGEGQTDSDIDLVADLDPNARLTILDLIEIEQHLEEKLGRGVDLVSRQGLKERFAAAIAPDEFSVF